LDIAVWGSYAYVAEGENGLRIIDISDPTVPVQTGFYDTPGGAIGVTLNGSYAYLMDGNRGLHVINISNPALPERVGYYDTPGIASDAAVDGTLAYIADETYFGVYDCSAALETGEPAPIIVPQEFVLHSACPNPFNAVTQIRFDVPRSAWVNLQVFDITGRLVTTLAAQPFEAGMHTVPFAANQVSSGAYFVRLQSGSFSTSQRITLIR